MGAFFPKSGNLRQKHTARIQAELGFTPSSHQLQMLEERSGDGIILQTGKTPSVGLGGRDEFPPVRMYRIENWRVVEIDGKPRPRPLMTPPVFPR